MFGSTRKLLIIALFTVLLIGLVNVGWWMFYRKTAILFDQQLSRRLAAVAGTARTAFSTDRVTSLAEGDFEAYMETIDLLEKIRETDSLSELFILDQDYLYLATTSLDEDSIYFLRELNSPSIDSLFFGLRSGVTVTPTYQSGDIFLKSAFAPLFDSAHFVLAVLGVEANVDYFDSLAELRRNLIYSTVVSVAGGLLFGFLFLLYQRRINLTEQQLYMNQTQSFLGRMVAVVSHEIKNPLMIIRASAERLMKKQPSDESGFIVEEVDRLNQLVTDYLDLARPDGKATYVTSEKKETIFLAPFVANLQRHISDKYADQQIKWINSKIPEGLTYDGYPRALRQVLLNLLINGAEACRDCGKPISVGIEAEELSSAIIIRVIDLGPGLTKKQIRKIFTPFYTTRSTGSGLGLYLCQKIVDEMGGRIDIESEVGRKTEVIINLPKKPKR